MDAPSEAKLADVHPELARRVRLLSDKCAGSGIWLRVDQGLRTWAEQDSLYAQGRTTPGKIVTDAQGGYSMHNFGLAVDIVPGDSSLPKFVPDWASMDVRWQAVLSIAKDFHLAEGAQWRTFPDRPHLYPQELPANPDDTMRWQFREGGVAAVWKELTLNAS